MTFFPVLILNPTAGSHRKSRQLSRIIYQLRVTYPNLNIVSTRKMDDGIRLAQEAVQSDCSLIICAGGDGTINEVINGLAGTDTALAILPTGTGNALAREIGLPTNALKATKQISTLKQTAVPLGLVNGRYFLLLTGIGFDAFVIAQVWPRLKKRIGVLAYVVAGFFSLFKYPYPTIRFEIQDRVVIGTSGFVSKARCELGPFAIAPQASVQEPWLHLFIFKGRGPIAYLRYTLAVLLGRHTRLPDVEYQKVKEVVASSDSPVYVHADGEPIKQARSYHIQVVNEKINLLFPPES
jgi:YegS/Rv2252/BmrU family lipid kinase